MRHHHLPTRNLRSEEYGSCAGCPKVGPLVQVDDGAKVHWVCQDCAR